MPNPTYYLWPNIINNVRIHSMKDNHSTKRYFIYHGDGQPAHRITCNPESFNKPFLRDKLIWFIAIVRAGQVTYTNPAHPSIGIALRNSKHVPGVMPTIALPSDRILDNIPTAELRKQRAQRVAARAASINDLIATALRSPR